MNLGPPPRRVKAAAIVLTTDFGLDDPYVGMMKGVICGIAPRVQVVDLTHGIPPQDVIAAQLALEAARPYFPPGSVHLAVVDPGVGTARRALALFTDRDVWVAPDNGMLSFLPQEEIRDVRALENTDLFILPLSRTFHGRDVFAPVAALLAIGLAPQALGPSVAGFVRADLPSARREGGAVVGEILAFDHFGNAVTSIRRSDLPLGDLEAIAEGVRAPWAVTYSAVPPGSPLCLVGSSDRLELSVRDGNARKDLRLRRGSEVLLRKRS